MFDDILDIDNACRLCLSSEGKKCDIFQQNPDPKSGYTLGDKILLLASVQLSPDDGLPSLVCGSCKLKVEKYIEFREQIEDSYRILQQCLGIDPEEESTSDILDIKPLTVSLGSDEVYSKHDKKSPSKNVGVLQKREISSEMPIKQEKMEVEDNDYYSDSRDELASSNFDEMMTNNDEMLVKKSRMNNMKIRDVSVSLVDITKLVKKISTTKCDRTNMEITPKININTQFLITKDIHIEVDSPDFIFSMMSVFEKDKFNMMDVNEVSPRISQIKYLDVDNIVSTKLKYKTYMCHLCLVEFRECTLDTLIKHSTNHFSKRGIEAVCQNEPPYVCEKCDREFLTRYDFINHTRGELKITIFPCDICKKSFSLKERLDSHNKIHLQKDGFLECYICDEKFPDAHQRLLHGAVHKNEKDVICKVCKKVYSSYRTLKDHSRRHENGLQFCCDFCGKGFYTHEDLKRHLPHHTGVRQFPCEICNKSFCSNTERRRHYRFHFNVRNHPCKMCDKKFFDARTLTEHMNMHLNLRPFVCHLCDSAFYGSKGVRKHVRNVHKIVNDKSDNTNSAERDHYLEKFTLLNEGDSKQLPYLPKNISIVHQKSGQPSSDSVQAFKDAKGKVLYVMDE